MPKKVPDKLHLNVIFRPEPEGGFTVLVPDLPGCITYGKSITEAQKMAREAVELYLEDMIADGEEPPRDAQTYLSTMEVSIPLSSRTVHVR